MNELGSILLTFKFPHHAIQFFERAISKSKEYYKGQFMKVKSTQLLLFNLAFSFDSIGLWG